MPSLWHFCQGFSLMHNTDAVSLIMQIWTHWQVTKNTNVDAVVNEHILQGCKTHLFKKKLSDQTECKRSNRKSKWKAFSLLLIVAFWALVVFQMRGLPKQKKLRHCQVSSVSQTILSVPPPPRESQMQCSRQSLSTVPATTKNNSQSFTRPVSRCVFELDLSKFM